VRRGVVSAARSSVGAATVPLTVAVGRSAGCPMRHAVRRPGCLAVSRPRRDRSRSSPTAGRPLLSATRPPARWSKRIRSTGPTC